MKAQIIQGCTHGHSKIGGCKECRKIYYRLFKEAKPAHYLLAAAQARARMKHLPFSITVADVVIPATCPVLGIPLDKRDRNHAASIDEVVQGLGYVPGNITVISGRANRIKSDATVEDITKVLMYMLEQRRIL